MARLGRPALAEAAALGLGLCLACRETPGQRAAPPAPSTQQLEAVPTAPPASASASASGMEPTLLPPLRPASELVDLEVPGFARAVVSQPRDASAPRPVVVALHGNFDRPEWQCEVWRRITSAQVFVLCPRGIPRRDVPQRYDRWEWGSLAKTKAELVAALAALRARFGAHVRQGDIVFTGFSLGAILGARLLQEPELQIGAAVLIEGGYDGWSLARAKAIAPLRYLLFACGQTACRNAYRYRLHALFERVGVSTSLVADVKAGHTYDDPLASSIAAEWPALLSALEQRPNAAAR